MRGKEIVKENVSVKDEHKKQYNTNLTCDISQIVYDRWLRACRQCLVLDHQRRRRQRPEMDEGKNEE